MLKWLAAEGEKRLLQIMKVFLATRASLATFPVLSETPEGIFEVSDCFCSGKTSA
jgi:hypothetical protein